jgi:hypothetical protein
MGKRPEVTTLVNFMVLSALVPASIDRSMKDEIFQAAPNTFRIVTAPRKKLNLRGVIAWIRGW